MAKILVQAETNPSIAIQLTEDDRESSRVGACTQCGFIVPDRGGMEDLLEAAVIHVERHEGEE